MEIGTEIKMAFDGIAVSALTDELNQKLINGRITKIIQPENDELLITIKNNREMYRLIMSANASLPLIYLTNSNKTAPITAPNFCMLLRKYIGNGKIIEISQPGLERIVNITIEHFDEMGDLCRKKLIVELMGKHSNIIFCNEDNKILDSIKHVTSVMSSVRQVLPGKQYFIPDTMNKMNPLSINDMDFYNLIFSSSGAIYKSIYSNLTGISPIVAQSLCYLSNIDADLPAGQVPIEDKNTLLLNFRSLINDINNHNYKNLIYYKNGIPVEFSSVPLSVFSDCTCKEFDSVSTVLKTFYSQKEAVSRIRQKSADLRRIVQTSLEKDVKKHEIQSKQLKDTEKREKYKIYGELITAYGYSVEQGSRSFKALNYYTNEEITIPLNPEISVMDNAKKYFAKYNKMKRTYEALSKIIVETENSIEYLESVSVAINIAETEEDLKAIRDELMNTGYIKFKNTRKKERYTSRPFHYISDDGFDIYVGKNNIQNEEITFKIADGKDWWFHAKGMPGSHVIIKSGGKKLPDKTFEQAARLAGFYSKGKGQTKVDIDYTIRKNIKKVAGAKPGFVIYHTNYSMSIVPDITGIKQI